MFRFKSFPAMCEMCFFLNYVLKNVLKEIPSRIVTFDQMCWRSLAHDTLSACFSMPFKITCKKEMNQIGKLSTNGKTFSKDVGVFCTLNCYLCKVAPLEAGMKNKNPDIYIKDIEKKQDCNKVCCALASKGIAQPPAFYITGVWLPSAVKHRVWCNKVGWWIVFLI